MFHLDNITRRFGSQLLFQGLSWRILPDARLGLVGPNGCGKTTLLRLISGEDHPDEGSLHRPRRARVGYLPQEVETVEEGSVLAVVLAGTPEIAQLERRMEQLERELATAPPESAESARLADAYGELRHRFEALEGHTLEARAKAILGGLGVGEASFHEPLATLSGGWRMRVVLARLLLGTPELLLLDEPTNHLDLEAIDWLESFLSTYEGAYVVVSHDRYFLNRLARGIVELERGRLTEYAGGYDDYLASREEREQALEKAARQQAREIAKTERFIERFRYKNTKAKQVQSRVKALSKVERIQTADQAQRIRFGFPPAPRSGDIVVRAEALEKRFGETVVYDGMDLLLRRGARVALVGPNGAGKSTLLKLLAGRTESDGGLLELGHKVAVHYYAQHQLDELDPSATVLEELERAAPADLRSRLRGLLGCFLFSGESVDKKVGVLSGGEKARLALARMLVRPANLLLLDEPTNHLDLRSREMLEEAINEYGGSLIVVSHDRYFINRVATSIAAVGDGRIDLHEGDYDEYLAWKEARAADAETAARAGAQGDAGESSAAREVRREEKRREAEERNRRYRQRREVELRLAPVETEIAAGEERLRELERDQADPKIYSDPERSAAVAREKGEIEGRLQGLYERWESLAAGMDGLE